ncbi:MFS transporter [Chloracidobacterium validum]|uniref:MFS transporter n=1 Tax=Chloracidobacterium validum TaxID=2821543 RepID=A0ABX8BGS9_9BACT|nr:MFS transporter [Chloracidobacterium validum]QUW04290.1 MFS transporter [Chloracidobacterium validum]
MTLPSSRETVAYWAVCLLILAALVDSQVIGAIAPSIAAGLGASKSAVAQSAAVYSLANAATAFWLGGPGRAMRPTRGLLLASLLAFAAALVAALAPNLWVFYLARAIAGFSGGLVSALAIAALANASTYAARGAQMSGVAVSYFLAPVIGVPLGAFLVGRFGWTSAFWFAAISVAVAGWLVMRFPLPEPALVGPSSGPPANVVRDLWRMATRSRSTRLAILGAAFVSGGLVAFSAFLGTWLSDAFRADEFRIGLMFGVTGLGAVIGGFVGGKLADRYGKRRVAVTASLWMALGLLLTPTFAWTWGLYFVVAFAALCAAVRVAPIQALTSELVAPHERPAFIALRNGFSQLGIVAAVAVAGLAYRNGGFLAVAAVCAAMTLAAWACLRGLDDPQMGRASGDLPKPQFWWFVFRRGLAWVLVLGLGFPYLVSVAITKARTRPDERSRTDTPTTLGAQYESVTFESAGIPLTGWYLPARTHQVTLVLTHGLFRSRYEMLERGVALWKLGYGVLLYEVRRHGQSRGEFSTVGYVERRDVRAAVEFVRRRAPSDRIVLLGVSMGAAASLLAAAETSEVAAVISDSSFRSFRDAVASDLRYLGLPRWPVAPLLTYTTAWRMGFAVDDFDLERAAGRIAAPILFIGGDRDQRMPVETTLEPLYRAARHPAKRKLVIAGAAHGEAYLVAQQRYVEAIDGFIRQALMLP